MNLYVKPTICSVQCYVQNVVCFALTSFFLNQGVCEPRYIVNGRIVRKTKQNLVLMIGLFLNQDVCEPRCIVINTGPCTYTSRLVYALSKMKQKEMNEFKIRNEHKLQMLKNFSNICNVSIQRRKIHGIKFTIHLFERMNTIEVHSVIKIQQHLMSSQALQIEWALCKMKWGTLEALSKMKSKKQSILKLRPKTPFGNSGKAKKRSN